VDTEWAISIVAFFVSMTLTQLLRKYLSYRIVRPATVVCYTDATRSIERFCDQHGLARPEIHLSDLTTELLLLWRQWVLVRNAATSLWRRLEWSLTEVAAIQNQGGMTAHWAKAFAGETKCTPSPVSYLVRGESSGDGVGYYYNRYWATRCVTIRSDGSFYVTAGSYSNTIRLNEFSSPDQHVNTNIDLPWGTGTILSYVAPIYDRWSGGAISSWAVYGVSQ
jgi:hypothetical protein